MRADRPRSDDGRVVGRSTRDPARCEAALVPRHALRTDGFGPRTPRCASDASGSIRHRELIEPARQSFAPDLRRNARADCKAIRKAGSIWIERSHAIGRPCHCRRRHDDVAARRWRRSTMRSRARLNDLLAVGDVGDRSGNSSRKTRHGPALMLVVRAFRGMPGSRRVDVAGSDHQSSSRFERGIRRAQHGR